MRFKKEDVGRTTVLLRDKNGASITAIYGATVPEVRALIDEACKAASGGETPEWTNRPRKPRVKKDKKEKAPKATK